MLAASIARAHAVDAALPEGGVKARIKMWQKAQQAITELEAAKTARPTARVTTILGHRCRRDSTSPRAHHDERARFAAPPQRRCCFYYSVDGHSCWSVAGCTDSSARGQQAARNAWNASSAHGRGQANR